MIRARGFDMKGAVDYVIPNSLQEMGMQCKVIHLMSRKAPYAERISN